MLVPDMPVASYDITLHRFVLCQYSEAVAVALACSGLNFSTAVYSAATFEQAKSVSPSGQLPLLTWGDTLLTESRDIIRHIASNVPQAGLSSESAPLTDEFLTCLLYTSPSPRDATLSRMPSSA